jgi:hypothetical protein
MKIVLLVYFLMMSPGIALGDTLADIISKQQKLSGMTAQVTQIKEAPYLLKPLESQIRFEYREHRIHWQVLSPVKMQVAIDRSGIILADSPNSHPAPNVKEFFTKISNLLMDLMEGKLATASKEAYIYSEKDRQLTWTPAPTTGPQIFKTMKITFDKQNMVHQVELNFADERTLLTFNQIKATYAENR